MSMTPTQFATSMAGILGLNPAQTAQLVTLFASDTTTVVALAKQANLIVNTAQGRLLFGPPATLASAATLDLDSVGSHLLELTGAGVNIAAVSGGSVENPIYFGRFTGANTLVHHATNMALPGGANIATAAGDTFCGERTANGFRVWFYYRANGQVVGAVGTDGLQSMSGPLAVTGAVSVGTAVAEGKVRAAAGVITKAWSADGSDVLIVENAGSSAIDVRAGAANTSAILFSSPTGRARGYVSYGHSDNEVLIGTAGSNRLRLAAGYLAPGAAGVQSCGLGSLPWSVVYANTSTISTSDLRLKTLYDDGLIDNATGLLTPLGLAVVGRVGAIGFQFNDAIADKGVEGARIHYGYGAQVWRDAFLAEGLDPTRSSLFCIDALTIRVPSTRPELRPVTELAPTTRHWVEIIDGEAHQRSETSDVPVEVFDEYPLFDVAGAPILEPAGFHPGTGLPLTRQAVHRARRMATVDVPCEIEQPLFEDDGVTQRVRLGLRIEECLVLKVAALETRMAALEAT